MQTGYGSLSLSSVPMATVEAVHQAAAKAGMTTRAWILRAIGQKLIFDTIDHKFGKGKP
uniref:Uncharacterized protein n=1 Tax=viral metagenome TaxID=1070528 RepID=A0A6M3LMQ7_9ZZZZ